jgi:S1-C subfamily serine protease
LYSAQVVRTDPDNDVALLKVNGAFHSLPFTTDTNANVNLGDSIFTIGFPVISLQGIEPKLTTGAINSLDGVQDDPTEFQISAAVQPGNSGGPLVDQFGNVIGIICARISDNAALQESGMIAQNVNYATKSAQAASLINDEPGLSAKLKKPFPPEDRKFSDIVQQTKDSVVLVLAY